MAPKISVSEIDRRAKLGDCWLVVNGKVYDLTRFAPDHPGGADAILTHTGRDASETYNLFHAADLIESALPSADKKGDLDEASVTEEWARRAANREAGETDETGTGARGGGGGGGDEKEKPRRRPPLEAIINLHDFEEAFARHGPRKAHAYIAGASNDEVTLRANAEHWRRIWFRPRVLVGGGPRVRTATRLLGQPVAMPLCISPMGIARTAGPEAEAALAAGAAAARVLHCLAVTTASMPAADVLAAAPPGYPFLYQLYVDRRRERTEALLAGLAADADAAASQVKALLVTVDLPVVSKREADERIRTAEETVSQYSTLGARSSGADVSGVSSSSSSSSSAGGGLARSTGSFIDGSLTWDDLPWLRRRAGPRLPIFLKGVQSAADARRALASGCAAGIVVSNHGGRALDGAPSSAAVLLELRRDCPEVLERLCVLVDGGVRRGSDLLKAVCLGARGAMVGRPFQCAVSYGAAGVERCANILQDELETAMQLCGVRDLEDAWGDMSYLNTSELEMLLPDKEEKYPPLSRLSERERAKL